MEILPCKDLSLKWHSLIYHEESKISWKSDDVGIELRLFRIKRNAFM